MHKKSSQNDRLADKNDGGSHIKEQAELTVRVNKRRPGDAIFC